MVDFNNETTIGTPAVDIVRILILQRHSDLIEAWEMYNKEKGKGIQVRIGVVRARLFSLYLQLQPSLKRRLKPKTYVVVDKQIREAEKEEEVIKQLYFLNEYLDELRITRIDTKKQYDSTNTETENKAKGL